MPGELRQHRWRAARRRARARRAPRCRRARAARAPRRSSRSSAGSASKRYLSKYSLLTAPERSANSPVRCELRVDRARRARRGRWSASSGGSSHAVGLAARRTASRRSTSRRAACSHAAPMRSWSTRPTASGARPSAAVAACRERRRLEVVAVRGEALEPVPQRRERRGARRRAVSASGSAPADERADHLLPQVVVRQVRAAAGTRRPGGAATRGAHRPGPSSVSQVCVPLT